MATDYPPADGNPYRFGAEDVWFFDGGAVVPPPGTMAPPRPPGMERRLRPPVEPSATAAQPQPQSDVPVLVARIEAAMETIHAALAEIKRLQTPPQNLPQSKAG